jgi:hypothetical protein
MRAHTQQHVTPKQMSQLYPDFLILSDLFPSLEECTKILRDLFTLLKNALLYYHVYLSLLKKSRGILRDLFTSPEECSKILTCIILS